MEGIGVLIAFVLVAAFFVVVILPIVALVRARGASENAALLRSEIEILRERTRNLTVRIAELEKGAAAAKVTGPAPPPSSVEHTAPTPTPVRQAEPPYVPVPAAVHLPPSPFAPLDQKTAPTPPVARPVEPTRVQPPSMEAARVHTTASAPVSPSSSAKPASGLKSTPPRNLADIEEVLGANWLNKIGITALVIGMALLLNYTMRYLGPGGKILLGYVCSAILIGIGVYGERQERYRMPARAVLGGGWALAYFTTYAMHNVAAVRLIESPELGFALLFAVAVAMVVHSLKYDSELATGFAYLLAFTAVAVSEIPLGALFASAILAASLVYVLKVRRWFIVEPLAIVATYFVHWLWLSQMFDRMGGPRPFPEFPYSSGLVTAYWVIYIVSYFLRKPESPSQKQLLSFSFLLNAAGYLTLLHAQSFHPEWRFWFLLFNGAAYFVAAGWARVVGRRDAFLVASTLGAVLMIGAIPYKYSRGKLEIIWLIETESLLLVGWRLADKYLRGLGAAAGAVLVGYVGATEVLPRFIGIGVRHDPPLAWVLVAIAGAFFLNGMLKSRLIDDASPVDELALTLSPILATLSLLTAAWVALPSMWIGFLWLVAGVALAELGLDVGDLLLRYCGYGAIVIAVGRLALWNLGSDDRWEYGSLRLFTVGVSCAILYLASRRHFAPAAVAPHAALSSSYGGFAAFYTGAATILAVPLILQELTSAAVALAFGVFGLLLLEAGDWLADNALSLEGAAVLCLSFGRIFVADLNATDFFHHQPDAVFTVPLLTAIFYFVAYRIKKVPAFRVVALCFGTASLAALIRFEAPSAWVAVWWAAFAVVLYALGRFVNDAFRFQAYGMTLLVALRCMVANFALTRPWSEMLDLRVTTVVAASVLLYALFVWSKLLGGASTTHSKLSGVWESLAEREFHLFFFVPTLLITALIGLEVRRGYLTAAWGVEAVVIFLAVLKLDERAYRWFSLGLLSICVLRIVLIDVWTLDALGRIISFIALGVALLLISFLYARHRELLRRVL